MTSSQQERLRMGVVAIAPRLFLASSLHSVYRCSQGRSWPTVRNWSHLYKTSIAQEGGTTTGRTWTGDGKRWQAELIVEFVQVLHLYSKQRRVGFLTPKQHVYRHGMRSELSSSRISACMRSGLSGKRRQRREWTGDTDSYDGLHILNLSIAIKMWPFAMGTSLIHQMSGRPDPGSNYAQTACKNNT
jgi:hypothetical protein